MKYIFASLLIIVNYVLGSANPDYWDPSIVKEAIPIVNLINFHRSDLDLWPIDYDYELQKELSLYKETYGSNWFSENSTVFDSIVYPVSRNINNTRNDNGVHVLKYGSFEYYVNYGYSFMFSLKNKKRTIERDLQIILRNGKKCFKRNLCSKTSLYVNSVTCMNSIYCDNRYAKILKPSFSRIACVKDTIKTYCYMRSSPWIHEDPFIEF